MTARAPDSQTIAQISARLQREEITPVLIGGMALVAYGSTRMTRDCDFAAPKTDDILRRCVHAMIDEGFSVIFGWDSENYLPTKLDSDKVIVGAWAAIDRPESIWFWHPEKSIRIDLVFDLPVPIEDILARAERRPLWGTHVYIAAPEDLQKMKEASLSNNPKRITDEQDLVYLRYIQSTAKKS